MTEQSYEHAANKKQILKVIYIFKLMRMLYPLLKLLILLI